MDSFIDNLKEVCRVTQEIQEKRKNTVRAFYLDRLTTGFGYYAIIFKLTYELWLRKQKIYKMVI